MPKVKYLKNVIAPILLVATTFSPISSALADEIPPAPVTEAQEKMLAGDCRRAIGGAVFRRRTELRGLIGINAPKGSPLYNGVIATMDALAGDINTLTRLENDEGSCNSVTREKTKEVINRMFDNRGYQ